MAFTHECVLQPWLKLHVPVIAGSWWSSVRKTVFGLCLLFLLHYLLLSPSSPPRDKLNSVDFRSDLVGSFCALLCLSAELLILSLNRWHLRCLSFWKRACKTALPFLVTQTTSSPLDSLRNHFLSVSQQNIDIVAVAPVSLAHQMKQY